MRLRIHRRSEVGAADGCVPGSVSTQPRAERGERAERELHGASARGRRSDGKTKARFIGPGRPGLASTGPRNKYLYACVRACVLFLQSRCRLLSLAGRCLSTPPARHGGAPRDRSEQLNPPPAPSPGCSQCFRHLLFPWYVRVRRPPLARVARHYFDYPASSVFFPHSAAVHRVESEAAAKGSLLRPCPILLTSVAGKLRACSMFPTFRRALLRLRSVR
jgi:hypothetical protein